MDIHMFHLDPTSASTLTLAQDQVGRLLTVALNDTLLGTLLTPGEFRNGRTFTLEDGATIVVRVVNQQVAVWHAGIRLTEVSTLTLAQDQVDGRLIVALDGIRLGTLNTRAEFKKGHTFTLKDSMSVTVRVQDEQVEVWLDGKRLVALTAEIALPPEAAPPRLLIKLILVLCSIAALVLALPGCWQLLRGWDSPGDSPSTLPALFLLGGSALPSLLALLVGVGHAITRHAWSRVALLGSPLLLPASVIPLVFFIGTFRIDIIPVSLPMFGELILLILLAFVVLISVVCLNYALRMATLQPQVWKRHWNLLLAGLLILVVLDGVGAWDILQRSQQPAGQVKSWQSNPVGITAGPDGNLWFTEQNGDPIGRITPAGVITRFPLTALEIGFGGITTGPDGALWFTERSKIGRMTPAGQLTAFHLPSSVHADRITTGPDGNLWFTDRQGNRIGRLTPAGRVTAFSLPRANSYPEAITAGPDGNLWVTEGYGLLRITPGGAMTEYPLSAPEGGPVSITVGPDGDLWFTESSLGAGGIGRMTPTGTFTQFPLPHRDSNSSPYWITAGPDGNLWFTEDLSSRIGRITPDGVITEFPLPAAVDEPWEIAAGPDGNLWFTQALSVETRGMSDAIGRITPAGVITEFPLPPPE